MALSKGTPLPKKGRRFFALQFYDVYSLGAFRTFFDIKTDLVTFGKTLKAIALDRRMVDKYIGVVFCSNEPEPFAVVKPLHGSLCDFLPPYL